MCPVVFLAFLFSLLLLLLEVTSALQVTFKPSAITSLKEGEIQDVFFMVQDSAAKALDVSVYSEKREIADLVWNQNQTWTFDNSLKPNGSWNGTFTVKGMFLGFVDIRLKTKEKFNDSNVEDKETVHVLKASVIRKEGMLSKVFIYSVAVLVSLNYINMGCALDLSVVKTVLVKPVAPILGYLCQFLVMPLVAFGVGKLLFPDSKVLQLGLFTFGCSPGGGASNMWTVLLNGNLNLSITLTFISTACALFMMPFWLFTLGRSLFHGSISKLPYQNIFTSLISMVVPLGIGLLMQRYIPRTAKFCRRIIAPASILMILYIIVFGTYANLYMFKIMTWEIILAATMNVWIGFLVALIVAKVFRQNLEDVIAISIETGVQNTGISIVLLGISLNQPSGDLASVVPVAASIMTPIPLLCALFIKKMYHCYQNGWSLKSRYELANEDGKQMVTSPSVLSSVTDEKFEPNGKI